MQKNEAVSSYNVCWEVWDETLSSWIRWSVKQFWRPHYSLHYSNCGILCLFEHFVRVLEKWVHHELADTWYVGIPIHRYEARQWHNNKDSIGDALLWPWWLHSFLGIYFDQGIVLREAFHHWISLFLLSYWLLLRFTLCIFHILRWLLKRVNTAQFYK